MIEAATENRTSWRGRFLTLTHPFNCALLAILFFAWAALTYWRTRSLGFFSDDWILLANTDITPHTLTEFLSIHKYSRPVYGLLCWLESLIAQGSPIYWQIISSLTVLLTTWAVWKVFQYRYSQIGYSKKAAAVGAIIGATGLLISPWASAVFVWPTSVLTLWSLIFFCLGYLRIQRNSLYEKFTGTAFVLIGFLTYEAYWLAFIPFLIIAGDLQSRRIKESFKTALLFALPLLLVLLYQRVALPYFFGPPIKSVSINWQLIGNNLFALKRIIKSAIYPAPWPTFLIFVIGGTVLSWISGAVPLRRLINLVLAVLIGLCTSATVYAIAGYEISGQGVPSRTMAAQSLFFALALGMLSTGAIEGFILHQKINLWRFLHSICLAGILISMLIGFSARLSEWSDIRDRSLTVLSGIRSALFGNSIDSVVVVEIEGNQDSDLFGGFWDLSGGIAATIPNLIHPTPTGKYGFEPVFFPAKKEAWQNIWDGNKFSQNACRSNRVCMSSEDSVGESMLTSNAPLFLRINKTGQVTEISRFAKFVPIGCTK